MTTSRHEHLLRQVSGLIDTILNLEKGSTFQIQGQRIYPSEVHLLLDLAAAPDTNATRLAGSLGLTKGAVSQTLTRLEKKGLVVKTRDTAAKNALNLEFTRQGTETVAYFRQKTAQMRAQVEQHLETLTAADRETIGGFLARLTDALEEMRGAD